MARCGRERTGLVTSHHNTLVRRAHALQWLLFMPESGSSERRTTHQQLTTNASDDARGRKVFDERSAAVRRWVEDDDECAFRSID